MGLERSTGKSADGRQVDRHSLLQSSGCKDRADGQSGAGRARRVDRWGHGCFVEWWAGPRLSWSVGCDFGVIMSDMRAGSRPAAWVKMSLRWANAAWAKVSWANMSWTA